MSETISKSAVCEILADMYPTDGEKVVDVKQIDKAYEVIQQLPSAQPEPDWDYSEETKQITLIVPEDVYNSAETIFLSVGYEGTLGIRGMVYSAQPERKKGRWVPIICTSDGKHHEWCGHQCSICGERTLRLMHHNFCPNCGNDMREEGERNEAD